MDDENVVTWIDTHSFFTFFEHGTAQKSCHQSIFRSVHKTLLLLFQQLDWPIFTLLTAALKPKSQAKILKKGCKCVSHNSIKQVMSAMPAFTWGETETVQLNLYCVRNSMSCLHCVIIYHLFTPTYED